VHVRSLAQSGAQPIDLWKSNGTTTGFSQYFLNCSAKSASFVVEALEIIGAPKNRWHLQACDSRCISCWINYRRRKRFVRLRLLYPSTQRSLVHCLCQMTLSAPRFEPTPSPAAGVAPRRRHFIIRCFPLMQHGVRLSTAFLHDLRSALTKEN
jgi:hypothetical protein